MWTTRVFAALLGRTKRKPTAVFHDHGAHFLGTFSRQLRVLEVGEETTPTGLPSMNCYAERAIGSIRRELLRHIRVADANELQFFLNEYRAYANTKRPHQGLGVAVHRQSPIENSDVAHSVRNQIDSPRTPLALDWRFRSCLKRAT